MIAFRSFAFYCIFSIFAVFAAFQQCILCTCVWSLYIFHLCSDSHSAFCRHLYLHIQHFQPPLKWTCTFKDPAPQVHQAPPTVLTCLPSSLPSPPSQSHTWLPALHAFHLPFQQSFNSLQTPHLEGKLWFWNVQQFRTFDLKSKVWLWSTDCMNWNTSPPIVLLIRSIRLKVRLAHWPARWRRGLVWVQWSRRRAQFSLVRSLFWPCLCLPRLLLGWTHQLCCIFHSFEA